MAPAAVDTRNTEPKQNPFLQRLSSNSSVQSWNLQTEINKPIDELPQSTRLNSALPSSPNDDETTPPREDHQNGNNQPGMLRKISVGVAGGALIAVGIPLIPLPGPGDFMVVGGLALLATEFPAAKRVFNAGRDQLKKFVGEDEEEEDDKQQEKGKEGSGEEVEIEFVPSKSSSPSNANDGTIKGEYIIIAANDVPNDDNAMNTPQIQSWQSGIPGDDNAFGFVIPTSKEVDDALKDVNRGMDKAIKRTEKSLKKFGRNTILPLMNRLVVEEEEEGIVFSDDDERKSEMRR